MSAPGWERVLGQDRAVALLQRAADRPVHAYLLVGPRGSGVEDAARCFAATLVAPDDERVWELVLRGDHPDVVEFEPTGNEVVLPEAREMIREAHASPIELDHKVVVLFGADRLRDEAANALLKTLEEPPHRTTLILVAERADRLLATIRSRCQRVDLESLDEATVRAAIAASVESMLPEARVALVARLAGGRLDRARLLAGRLGPLRDAFLDAVESLDGTGSAVERAAEMLVDVVAETVKELEQRHAEELERFDAEYEAAGYPTRIVGARRKVLLARHKREHRRARTDAWLEGITAIESIYRDVLAGPGAPRLNLDRDAPAVHARGAVAALEVCRRARRGLVEFNANETLTLERVLLHLPPGGSPPPGRDGGPPR